MSIQLLVTCTPCGGSGQLEYTIIEDGIPRVGMLNTVTITPVQPISDTNLPNITGVAELVARSFR